MFRNTFKVGKKLTGHMAIASTVYISFKVLDHNQIRKNQFVQMMHSLPARAEDLKN